MANNDVTVKLKIEADTSGEKKVEAALKNTEKAAKKSFTSFVGGFENAKRAAEKFKSVVESVAQIGFLKMSFDAIIGLVDKLRSAQQKAKEEAIAHAEAERDAANTANLEKLIDTYGKLEEQISKANKERERGNEIDDMKRSAADKLEDDTAELNMMQDVAALDENDPLYDKKKAQIMAKYNADKLKRSVARQKRDLNIAEERTYQEQESIISEADAKEFSLMDDKANAADLRNQAAALRAQSAQENEFDNNSMTQQFLHNLKSIFTLNWDKFGDSRSDKGDELRKQQEQKANDLEQKANEQDAMIAAKQKNIADLRSNASHLGAKAAAYGDMSANLSVRSEIADMTASSMVSSANTALNNATADISDATKAKALLSLKRDSLMRQIANEQDRKSAAGMSVYQAQTDFETAQLAGKGVSNAYDNLQSAKNAAQNVEHSANTAINALTETLNQVNQKLNEAANFLKSNQKQTRNFLSETPPGA